MILGNAAVYRILVAIRIDRMRMPEMDRLVPGLVEPQLAVAHCLDPLDRDLMELAAAR